MSDLSIKDGSEQTRRYFLEVVGAGAVGVTVLGSGVFTWQYLSPNVLFEPPSAFQAGRPGAFARGTVTTFASEKTYVVRNNDGTFYAMSTICTHLGCLTDWKEDADVAACPCHGSVFSRHGDVLKGPAPRALSHYLMAVDPRGDLVVDRGVLVDPGRILKV